MKKFTLVFSLLFITGTAFSQISVALGGNYTMYKGDFQKSTPGAQIRVGYAASERIRTELGFTYGFPITQASSVLVADGIGNTVDVDSEIKYKFKTISLLANYNFIGDEETSASLYGQFGASFVLVNYKEDITGSYDKNVYTNPLNQIGKTNESGFTINLGLGGEYRFGTPAVFAEAGIALPANQVGNTYVENVIPSHFVFNLGVRISFGGGYN
ncbi:MAG TPA: hypothetical protein VGO58_05405 [Chitinophagaceae bacterium]|nr:hypothetical protein [Chitinophagaceae bacterium]